MNKKIIKIRKSSEVRHVKNHSNSEPTSFFMSFENILDLAHVLPKL